MRYRITAFDELGYVWLEFEGMTPLRVKAPLTEDGEILNTGLFEIWLQDLFDGDFVQPENPQQKLLRQMNEYADREIVYTIDNQGRRVPTTNFRSI